MMRSSAVILLACAPAGLGAGVWPLRAPWRRQEPVEEEPLPLAVAASHDLPGHAPSCAVDGHDDTCWLVPGSQRMEAMAHDKWIVLDAGRPICLRAVSLLGLVDSFAPARLSIECAPSPRGPWMQVHRTRALGELEWERVELPEGVPSRRYFRLYTRREGHASFRYAIHGVRFHVDPEEDAAGAEYR